MVGAFGDAAANYWWARYYACIHRLHYAVGDPFIWGLVFVDDALWALPLAAFWQEATLVLLLPWILFLPTCLMPCGWLALGLSGPVLMTLPLSFFLFRMRPCFFLPSRQRPILRVLSFRFPSARCYP